MARFKHGEMIHRKKRPARPKTIAEANERLFLDHLLITGGCTRTQLRDATGLAQPTVSSVLDRLKSKGLIKTGAMLETGSRGPNAEMFQINGARANVGVVRASPDFLRISIRDLSGELLIEEESQLLFPDTPADEFATALAKATKSIGLSISDLSRILVGVPGPLDPQTQEPLFVAARPTWGLRIRQSLEKAVGRSLQFANQMNLAGLAEYRYGGHKESAMCLVGLGPSAGMALILDGKIWTGANGGAGEIAFMPTTASPDRAFAAELNEIRDTAGTAALFARVAASIVAIVDPGLIVLTGEKVQSSPRLFLKEVSKHYQAISRWPVKFETSKIDGDAVLLGGAALVLDEVRDEIWGISALAPKSDLR